MKQQLRGGKKVFEDGKQRSERKFRDSLNFLLKQRQITTITEASPPKRADIQLCQKMAL